MKNETLAILWWNPIVKEHTSLITSWPNISASDIFDIINLFKQGKVSGRNSDIIQLFEKDLSEYLNVWHVALFNSWTAALHSALRALDIWPWDEVIVPSFTFSASALSVMQNLSIPVFCDINKETYNIDYREIEKNITDKTKAIMVVHLHGLPADMENIMKIARKHDLKVIEDCAQAFGAKIWDKFCWTFWDIWAFSMNPAKQLPSCGELWCIVTNNIDYMNKANITKMYWEVVNTKGERQYNAFTLWYNYIPNTIQSIFANNKLKEFDNTIWNIIKNANRLAKYIDENLDFIKSPIIPENNKHVFHMFRVRVDWSSIWYDNNKVLRQAIMDIMEKEWLKMRSYQNTPVSWQTVFKNMIWFGKWYPWAINSDRTEYYKENYAIENYPNTLNTISETFIIWWLWSAPLYFQNPDSIDSYIAWFEKIKNNIPDLIAYAKSLESEYSDPWEWIAKISDTNWSFTIIK